MPFQHFVREKATFKIQKWKLVTVQKKIKKISVGKQQLKLLIT